jgi:hypothetical protein
MRINLLFHANLLYSNIEVRHYADHQSGYCGFLQFQASIFTMHFIVG